MSIHHVAKLIHGSETDSSLCAAGPGLGSVFQLVSLRLHESALSHMTDINSLVVLAGTERKWCFRLVLNAKLSDLSV